MTPPKVLGVDMLFESHHWWLSFGSVRVGIGEYGDDKPRCATLGGRCIAHQLSLPDCIAAIERELLAIKSAIPDAPTTGGDDGP